MTGLIVSVLTRVRVDVLVNLAALYTARLHEVHARFHERYRLMVYRKLHDDD